MPTGIYNRLKSKPNAGLFKKGEHRSSGTEIKRGQHLSRSTEFKPNTANYFNLRCHIYTDPDWLTKQSNSHKGQHSSPTTEFKKGEHYSPDTEFKEGDTPYVLLGSSRPELSGERHWNWKGGITKSRHLLRNCGKYHEWRISVFRRDHFTCQECGCIGGLIEAHHKLPVSQYLNLIYDLDNGVTLCKNCHSAKSVTKGGDANAEDDRCEVQAN